MIYLGNYRLEINRRNSMFVPFKAGYLKSTLFLFGLNEQMRDLEIKRMKDASIDSQTFPD